MRYPTCGTASLRRSCGAGSRTIRTLDHPYDGIECSSPPKRVSDSELQSRAIQRAYLELGEETVFVRHTDKHIDTRLRIRITPALDGIERRAPSCINIPWLGRSEVIGKLDVECRDSDVVTETNLDIRSKAQSVSEWWGLNMRAEIELFGLN